LQGEEGSRKLLKARNGVQAPARTIQETWAEGERDGLFLRSYYKCEPAELLEKELFTGHEELPGLPEKKRQKKKSA